MREEPAIIKAMETIAKANVTILEMRVFEGSMKHSKPTQIAHLKAGYCEYLDRTHTHPKSAGMHPSLLAWLTSLVKLDEVKVPAAPAGQSTPTMYS